MAYSGGKKIYDYYSSQKGKKPLTAKSKRKHKRRSPPVKSTRKKAKKHDVLVGKQISRQGNIPGTVSAFKGRRVKPPRGFDRLVTKMTRPQWDFLDQSGNMEAGYNLQGAYDLYDMLSYNDLSRVLVSAGGGTSDTSKSTTQRVYVEHVQQKWMYTNQTNSVVHMDIYDVRTKKNLHLTGTGQRKPMSDFFGTGLKEESGSSTDWTKRWGVTPGDSLYFKKHCKVVGKVHVTLGPGEVHEHSVFYPIKRMFDGNTLKGLTAGDGVPGWTRWTCAIVYGAAGNQTDAMPANRQLYGLTAPDIDWVMFQKIRFRSLNIDESQWWASATTFTMTHANVMDEMSGVSAAETSAGPINVL